MVARIMAGKALLVAGLILVVLAPASYFLGLHPATGAIGGTVLLLTDWVSPDLFWLGVGLVAASFLPRGALLKTAAVITAYGLSALPVALIKTSAAQPTIQVRAIENAAHRFSAGDVFTIERSEPERQFVVGRNLPQRIGANEGCMCYYFGAEPTIAQFLEAHVKSFATVTLPVSEELNGSTLVTNPRLALIDGQQGYEVRFYRREQGHETDRHVFRILGLSPSAVVRARADRLRDDFWRQATLNFVFSPWPARLANRVFLTPIERELKAGILDQVF
jgi:hypothetical protein